tara:strand:+ start:2550 stop:3173 length:624 start_codon:yes stop_codon:yes gene_type:complete
MILNKYLILMITTLLFISCEEQEYDDETCLNGIEETVEATSFINWIYITITDTGFVKIDITEEQAQIDTTWDIAMMRNHFRTNSGTSGPGDGGVLMLDNTWSCEIFNEFSEVPGDSIFLPDDTLTNIYQPWAHEDPDAAYTEAPGSSILENWGWFDIDNDYYFYYTHKQFIVKLPSNRGYIKLWPYQYYGELGQSAHTTLVYDFIQE